MNEFRKNEPALIDPPISNEVTDENTDGETNPFLDTEQTILDGQQIIINRMHKEMIGSVTGRMKFDEKKILDKIEDPKKRAHMESIFESQATYIKEFLRTVAEEKYRDSKEADTDKISGLLRKEAFEKMYESSLTRRREDEHMVMITFDLDKFKDINESIGHVAADKILGKIGVAIQETIRVYDFASRIGGDEFVILLNNVKKDADVLQLVERIAVRISEIKWEYKRKEQGISFSAGFSIIPDKSNPTEVPYVSEVRERADEIAGFSKQLGRNRVTVTGGGKYIAYEMKDGKYIESETGNVVDLKKDTPESCLREVMSNLQRILEEIERTWGVELKKYIGFAYKSSSGKPAEGLEDLSIKQIAGLLLESRKKQKEEK
ncbi:GGDEF domain-containing protein [Patescibacteria group bacterium]|nr:GGDEF domain-containing protein [Patescibacteria group bacterium]